MTIDKTNKTFNIMRRIIFSIALLFAVTFATAQEAYYDAIRMARETAEDTSKPLEERKIARFKQIALEYLGTQSYKLTPDSAASVLDYQALALYKFINAFTYQLTIANKKSRQGVIDTFKQASLNHPRFNDPNKEYVLAYITNEGYLTKFSLDTDWVRAYEEIERKYSSN